MVNMSKFWCAVQDYFTFFPLPAADIPDPDDITSQTFDLPDGRKLGYGEFGPVDAAHTVFFLHGTPGSRYEAAHLTAINHQLGVRMIGVDRPGIGLSSPHPGRSFVSHARDIERLAEGLGIREYGLIGASGGGPYLLACAKTMPREHLKAVSIMCGLGLRDMPLSGLGWHNWIGFIIGWPYFPTLGAKYCSLDGQFGCPEDQRFALAKSHFAQTLKDPRDHASFDDDMLRIFLRSIKTSYRQGFQGPAQDGWTICQPVTFRIEDIRKDLPVQLWYGKDDLNVPASHGELIAQRLSKRDDVVLHVSDDTHASVFIRNREAAMRELITSMSG